MHLFKTDLPMNVGTQQSHPKTCLQPIERRIVHLGGLGDSLVVTVVGGGGINQNWR
jgi:hypothetical protein